MGPPIWQRIGRRDKFFQPAVLLLTSGLTFFPFLGNAPIVRVQEVRVLETAREMGVTGDFISPRFCGELRLEKPPLAYWLAWGGFLIRGEPDEAAGRLYSALSGTLTVLLLHAFGRAMGRPWLGTWAGLMLATSFLFYRASRRAETDVLLTCAVTGAFYCFFRAMSPSGPAARGPTRLWAVLGWGAMAIGFLAKGPAALLLPLISIAIYVALSRQWSRLAVLFNPWGIAVFLLLALPWCLEVMRREGLALDVFVRELHRTAEGDNHRKEGLRAWTYYPAMTVAGFAPWCLLLPPAVWCAARNARQPSAVAFILAWAGGILLQLQFVGNKQQHHLAPVLPPLALIAAHWLTQDSRRAGRPAGARAKPVWATVGLVVTVAGMLVWSHGGLSPVNEKASAREFSRTIRPMVESAPVFFSGVEGIGVPLLDFYLRRVVPRLEQEAETRKLLVDQRKPFFVITQEAGFAARESAAFGEEVRIDLLHASRFLELPLLLFRMQRAEPRLGMSAQHDRPGTDNPSLR